MREVDVEVESAELARTLSNVLAFVSARCIFPWIRLELLPWAVIATGGDLWAVGQDEFEPILLDDPGPPVQFVMTRPDVIELEKLARSDRKGRISGRGHLRVVGPGPTNDWYVSFEPGDPELREVPYTAIAYGAEDLKSIPLVKGEPDSAYSPAVYFLQVDMLLMELETVQPWDSAHPLAFEPDILSRFAKVRRHDIEPTIMDCWISSPDDPIHVKIGPSFTGAIMPILREVYEEKNPAADGTWQEDAA